MELCTIGFTKKSAADFFGALRGAKIERLIDVRLNNVSQLAGFTKKNDLAFFVRELVGAEYVHELRLAPRDEDLVAYRAGKLTWVDYEQSYAALLRERKVEKTIPRSLLEVRAVLLCSEATPEHCHRRLAAEYLAAKWGGITIRHL
jgi:uncharacterized protein (DUF488 family)